MSQDYYCKLRYNLTDAFDQMDDKEVASIVRRMLHFMQNMDMPALTETATALICWAMVESDLAQDKADRENGKKGGRPTAGNQKNSIPSADGQTSEKVNWLC